MSLDQELSTVWHSQIELSPFGRFGRQVSQVALWEKTWLWAKRHWNQRRKKQLTKLKMGRMERFSNLSNLSTRPGVSIYSVEVDSPLYDTSSISFPCTIVKFESTKHRYDVDWCRCLVAQTVVAEKSSHFCYSPHFVHLLHLSQCTNPTNPQDFVEPHSPHSHELFTWQNTISVHIHLSERTAGL